MKVGSRVTGKTCGGSYNCAFPGGCHSQEEDNDNSKAFAGKIVKADLYNGRGATLHKVEVTHGPADLVGKTYTIRESNLEYAD